MLYSLRSICYNVMGGPRWGTSTEADANAFEGPADGEADDKIKENVRVKRPQFEQSPWGRQRPLCLLAAPPAVFCSQYLLCRRKQGPPWLLSRGQSLRGKRGSRIEEKDRC